MEQAFTQNDLVRFAYRETSASETIDICEALDENSNLYAQYEAIETAKQILPRVKFRPTVASVRNILDYSQERTLEAFC